MSLDGSALEQRKEFCHRARSIRRQRLVQAIIATGQRRQKKFSVAFFSALGDGLVRVPVTDLPAPMAAEIVFQVSKITDLSLPEKFCGSRHDQISRRAKA